jgi:hypothetical protein
MIVNASRLPFASRAGGGAFLVNGTYCDFNAPGTWCGVAVSFSAHAPGGAAIGASGGFQSQAGSGASQQILIGFGSDVDGFKVNVHDPDFVGNNVIARNASGSQLEQVIVNGDGAPGTLTIEPVTITANGIRTVELNPAPGDYVAYTGAGFPVADSIVVNCTPNPVVRGGTITCTATTSGSSQPTVTDWRFKSASLLSDITETTSATQWQGPLVTPGFVIVNGTINGAGKSDTVAVTVTPRNWSADTVDYLFLPNEPIPGPLMDPPTRIGDLGAAHHSYDISTFQGSQIGRVTSGPNANVLYWLRPPGRVRTAIWIRTDLLVVNSWFYNKQHGGGQWCPASAVPGLLPHAHSHEGTSIQAGSHARVYHDSAQARVPGAAEAMVVLSDSVELVLSTHFVQDAAHVIAAGRAKHTSENPPGLVPDIDLPTLFGCSKYRY